MALYPDQGSRAYLTPVPDDLHDAVDPILYAGTPMPYQEYHRMPLSMPSVHGNQAYTVAGSDGVHFLVAHDMSHSSSSLSQLLSPDFTVVQSPSMASEAACEGVSTPPDTAAMYPQMDVDCPSSHHSHTPLYPRSFGCVNPAEITSGPSLPGAADMHYGRAVQYHGGVMCRQSTMAHMSSTHPVGAETRHAHELPHDTGAALHRSREGADACAPPSPRTETPPACGERLVQIPRASFERTTRFSRFSVSLESEQTPDRHTQLFPCLFQAAGCNSGFPGKNEWKRHINTIHVGEEAWVCGHGHCASFTIESFHEPASREPAFPTSGRIFNRKDLYMSHLDRTHRHLLPDPDASKSSKKQPSPELERIAAAAWHRRVVMPTHLTCAVDGCADSFSGPSTWDDFLEHVADHLKKTPDHAPAAPPVVMHMRSDAPLMSWAVAAGFLRPAHDGRWHLRDAVRSDKPGRKRPGVKRRYDDEADWGLVAAGEPGTPAAQARKRVRPR